MAPDAECKREEVEANEREEADHRAHSVLEEPRSAVYRDPGWIIQHSENRYSGAIHFRKHLSCSETKNKRIPNRAGDQASELAIKHAVLR